MQGERQNQLEEVKRHGDVLFPFNIYPCTIPDDLPSVALHWHRNMEVVYVKRGVMTLQMDIQTKRVEGGAICIAPPCSLHGLRAIDGKTAEYENIIFDVEMLGSGAADMSAKKYLVPLVSGQLLKPMVLMPGEEGYGRVAACLRRAELLNGERPPGYEIGIKAALLELIFHLMQMQPPGTAEEPSGTMRLRRVIERVQHEYARKLTIQDMADECGISPSHFMRWFQEATGSTFVTYLNEYRLAEAARLLKDTDEKILSIAQDVGFDSLSNFNQQFQKRYGSSPRKYRTDRER